MPIKKSSKEFILSLYLKKYPQILEEIFGQKISHIELERKSGGKKIDFHAVSKQRRLEIYVENQVTPSDINHLNEKVKPIVMSLNEGVIIWIAARFNPEHIKEIKSLLKTHRQKYIDFYAIEIHGNVLLQLDQLNSLNKLDIWDSLDVLNRIEQPFKVVAHHKQIPQMHVGKTIVQDRYDLTRLDDIKNYTLEKLRERIPQYPNIHKAKKHNESNPRIVIGGERDGIEYNCSVRDRRNLAYVELYFSKNHQKLFEQLRVQYDYIKKQVHPDLVMKKGRIGVYFEPYPDLDETISRISEILEKMIIFFTPVTYYSEDIPFIREDREGDKGTGLKNLDRIRGLLRDGFQGIHPKICELMLEEVDNEQAYRANLEQLSEYMMMH